MKRVSELVPQLTKSVQHETNDDPSSTPTITPEHIAELWERMAFIYGHKWVSNFGTEDNGTWFRVLKDMTPQHIARGLARCVESPDDWPPSLPRFRDMCWLKPEDVGIPDYEAAYAEAVHGTSPHNKPHTWSHPVVFHAAYNVGSWNLHHFSEDKTRALFRMEYDHVVKRFMLGDSLEVPTERRIGFKKYKPTTPERAAEWMGKIRSMLRGKG